MPFGTDSPFTISQIPGSDQLWKLEVDLVCYDNPYIEDTIISKGTVRDGSSIPQLAWGILGHPIQGAFGPCGWLHDDLYRLQEYSRKICDLAYRHELLSFGLNWWKAQTVYLALRWFGWVAWKRYLDY